MKSGILKLMLLSIPLVPLIAQAASESGTPEKPAWKIEKKPSATFDSGESESEGTGATLRSDQDLKDGTASPASASTTETAATAATTTASPSSSTYEYEPGVNSPPRAAKKSKKSSAKATAQTTQTAKPYRTSIETAYRPAALAAPVATEDATPKTEQAIKIDAAPPAATSTATSTAKSTQNTAAASATSSLAQSDMSENIPPRPVKKIKKSSSRPEYRTSIETAYRPAAFETAVTAEAPPTFLALDAKAHWKIRSGERISEVMLRWTKAIGWQLTWEPEDLIAMADLDLEDTFTGATTKVIDALNRNGTDMQAKFYASNHMLRITVRK